MSEVKTMNNKQVYDYIKRLSGNTNDCIEEFNDYVKSIEAGAGCGNTSLRIFTKLLDKNKAYFRMAYDAGKKEVATLVMKLAREGLFREIDLIEEVKKLQAELAKKDEQLKELLNCYKSEYSCHDEDEICFDEDCTACVMVKKWEGEK